jgi:putative membrane protein
MDATMDDATGTDAGAAQPGASTAPNLSLISTQLSWQRSDLANLRTLLAWARTSVSMIGFGFTIFNFYRGFLQDLIGSGRQDAARNLGVALVAAGTLMMAVAILNFWTVNQALRDLEPVIQIPRHFRHRWLYTYALAGLLMLIGTVTLVFMLRVA